MSYKLVFKKQALKEFEKLPRDIANQFQAKLKERLQNPRIASAQLRQLPDCYKIKLRNAGYRLVYQVIEDEIVVCVIAVGRRERNLVYAKAKSRL